MSLYAKVVQRWIAKTVYGQAVRDVKSPRLFYSGDSIFSYGRHFEMARVLRNADGEPRLILVNGDTYSVTTNRHQSILRNELITVPVPKIIIPYSVLSAAGIDFNTIEPIEITEDTTERVMMYATRDQLDARPAMRTVEGTDIWVRDKDGSVVLSEYGTPVDKWHAYDVIRRVVNPNHRYAYRNADGSISSALPDAGATWRMATGHAYLDGCEESWQEDADGNRVTYIPEQLEPTGEYRYYTRGSKYQEWDQVGPDTFTHSRYVHHLGESLIRATYTAAGRLDPATQWTQDRRWLVEPKDTSALFLSGFDENESRPAYFFCQLPEASTAATVAEAREDLKAPAVRLAEDMGREVRRQGDQFAIQTGLTKRDLTKMGATFEKHAFLLGTNHRATEVALLPDGMTFARGTMTHAPQWRRPDHKRVAIKGPAFWLMQRNTVPTA